MKILVCMAWCQNSKALTAITHGENANWCINLLYYVECMQKKERKKNLSSKELFNVNRGLTDH